MKKKSSKADKILIGILTGVILFSFLIVKILPGKVGDYVVIEVDGIKTQSYPLSEDATIPIYGGDKKTNTLQIQDGKAKMTEADCKDHLCMKQKAISKDGETIICLPNKVVVTVYAKETSDTEVLDAVVGAR